MDVTSIRQQQIVLMKKTLDILGNVLASVSQAVATTLQDDQDGPQGWTVVEVVCHLRDFDGFFQQRAQMMLDQTSPQLPAFDQAALAVERDYISQDVHLVYDELVESRRQFVEFFTKLTPEQWECDGTHPTRGHFTMTDAVMQVSFHDATHIEQITRILNGG
ncbi:MAG: DinB family protein [Chloroflexi bacterium]|nr:DinB family protein [Chloroflexota bacterium]